jgi:alkylation response protein AidB-like acyl-CoA dehydrogenase
MEDWSDRSDADIRTAVRGWLEENWDPDRTLIEWRNILVDSGWGAPTWPIEWFGRNLTDPQSAIVQQEFDRIGAVSVARTGIRMLAAATILVHGNQLHKGTFLRRILTGEDTWCQLFSEPGSGSDLAGATTRADLKDGRWIVNGQKVWTTSAHHADYGLLLARTDWDVPKHNGLSYFLIDMHQAGVDVNQLKQMNGHASFNQIFFTDAVVEPGMQMGELGEGWKIATTTLMHERRSADGLRRFDTGSEREGRIYEEEREEVAHMMAPYTWYPQRMGRVDLLIGRAKETGAWNDPVIRQEIAKLLCLAKSAEWTARRARAAQEKGGPQGPEGSLGKLAASNVARAANHVHTMISGAEAMLTGGDSPMGGVIAEILVSTPAISIAGGTDEIQKNIISERVLRMPKEPRTDTDRPFRDVPRNRV